MVKKELFVGVLQMGGVFKSFAKCTGKTKEKLLWQSFFFFNKVGAFLLNTYRKLFLFAVERIRVRVNFYTASIGHFLMWKLFAVVIRFILSSLLQMNLNKNVFLNVIQFWY